VFYRDGLYEDALCFGILRSEWEDDLQDSAEQAEQDQDELPVCDPALVTK
jgi:hypothetical protein